MPRPIEFRAKFTYNNEWVYGYYRHVLIPGNLNGGFNYDCHKIYDPKGNRIEHDVEEDTVGQYTGQFDKDDVKIFEGDIVKGYIPDPTEDIFFDNAVVLFVEGSFCLWTELGENRLYLGELIHSTANKSIKIIGNIHDNPELLRETKL